MVYLDNNQHFLYTERMKYIIFALLALLISGCSDKTSIAALSNRIDNLHTKLLKVSNTVTMNKSNIEQLVSTDRKNNKKFQGILIRLKNEELTTDKLKKAANSPKLPNFRIIPVSHLKFGIAKKKKIAATVNKKVMYRNALDLFKKGKYDSSIILFKRFIQQNPKSSLADNAQFWIAQNFLQQSRLKEAVKALNILLTTYKKLPERRGGKADVALYQLYRIYIKLNQAGKAINSLRELVSIFPKNKYSRKIVKSLLGGRR